MIAEIGFWAFGLVTFAVFAWPVWDCVQFHRANQKFKKRNN